MTDKNLNVIWNRPEIDLYCIYDFILRFIINDIRESFQLTMLFVRSNCKHAT